MSQARKMRRKSGLSKREQERLNERKSNESAITKLSRIIILVVFAAMIISLAYTVVALSGY